MKKPFPRFFPHTVLPLVIVFLASLAFNCGKSTDSRTITFWHFWSEPNQLFEIKNIVRDFERTHPGMHVALTDLNWTEGKVKLFGAFNANQPPDVLQLGIEWIPEFASAGVLKKIALDSASYARFLRAAVSAASWNGSLYAVPWTVNTRAMFCNLALLRKAGIASPPYTWVELLADTRKINSLGGDIHGFGSNAYQPHNLYKKILPFFWQNGGDIFTPDGKDANVNSQEDVAALAYYDSLGDAGLLEESRVLDDDFVRGTIGIWISGAWLTDRIKNENPSLQYSVIPMPVPDAHNTGWSILGGDFLSISNKSEKDSAAMTFINYLTSKEASRTFCSIVSDAGEPADSTAYDGATADAAHQAFHEQIIHSRSIPPQARWLEIEGVMEKYFSETIYHRMPPKEALDSTQTQMEMVLHAAPKGKN